VEGTNPEALGQDQTTHHDLNPGPILVKVKLVAPICRKATTKTGLACLQTGEV
jgi:hypothetical protein